MQLVVENPPFHIPENSFQLQNVLECSGFPRATEEAIHNKVSQREVKQAQYHILGHGVFTFLIKDAVGLLLATAQPKNQCKTLMR